MSKGSRWALIAGLIVAVAVALTFGAMWYRAMREVERLENRISLYRNQRDDAVKQLQNANKHYWGVFSPENLLKLRIGMSPEQVTEIFGDPVAIETERLYASAGSVMNLYYNSPYDGLRIGPFDEFESQGENVFSFEPSTTGYRLLDWKIEKAD